MSHIHQPMDRLNVLLDDDLVTGGHTAMGAEAPRVAWWFAEGYTAPGFDQYFAILNPNDTPAEVRITYFLNGRPPVVKQLTVPATARATVTVHDRAQGVGRGQEVGAKVESTNGLGLVVERSMYFAYRLAADYQATIDPALIPPEELIFVSAGGRSAFVMVSQWFLDCFIDLCHLRPDERVLDIGCGIGRMAAGLTTYLSPAARYEGFDIVPAGIDWCRQTITPRFPNFHFQLADIYNAHYHPSGTLTAAEYRFPYSDEAFDFAFATSVLTHLFPPDVERYLAEVARVLRPGGRCLLTFFLLNARSLPPIEAGTAQQDFRHRGDGYRTAQPDQPEAAIAYDEGAIRALCVASGLRIVEPIRFGSWSGRRGGYSYQDIIIAVK